MCCKARGVAWSTNLGGNARTAPVRDASLLMSSNPGTMGFFCITGMSHSCPGSAKISLGELRTGATGSRASLLAEGCGWPRQRKKPELQRGGARTQRRRHFLSLCTPGAPLAEPAKVAGLSLQPCLRSMAFTSVRGAAWDICGSYAIQCVGLGFPLPLCRNHLHAGRQR